MKYKKSAVDLTDLAIGIIVLGIVVSIGAVILLNVRDATLTDLGIGTTINESVVINTSASDTLANSWVRGITECFCNVTGLSVATEGCGGNETIVAANYSVSVSAVDGTGTMLNLTGQNFPDAECTYTWYNTSEVNWQLPNDAALGLAEYGNWFDIIVIVGVAGLILTLIFMAFGRQGNEAGGITY